MLIKSQKLLTNRNCLNFLMFLHGVLAECLYISIRWVSEAKNLNKIWQSVYPQSSVRPVDTNTGQAERSLCQKVFTLPDHKGFKISSFTSKM